MINYSNKTFGATLLVAGCCIGAGMLGLPVLSALAGFIPSLVLFVFCWMFMVATGLLLLEVNLWFSEEISLVTMAKQTLGLAGQCIAWGGFLFLFYTLMVAYISGTGELLQDFIVEYYGYQTPFWLTAFLASSLLGILVYLGTGAVDRVNRLFMVGLVLTYVALIALGGSNVKASYLKHIDWSASYLVIPTMIISFGYHNMIPTLSNYLNRNVKQLRISIIVGSAIPLIIYIIWEWLLLGLIPVEGEGGFRSSAASGDMATRALKNIVGNSIVLDLAQAFAFFAIVTSFLGVALSFVDFLADGLRIKKDPKGKLLLCFLVITLPLICALAYPWLFLIALSYAGSFGAAILFGILPVFMAWYGRDRIGKNRQRLIPGGKIVLLVIGAVALLVTAIQFI